MRDRTSRKGFLGVAGVGLAAALTGDALGAVRAAPKKKTKRDPNAKAPYFLFVQTARNARIKKQGPKHFKISLADVSAATIAFSDRPARDVSAPTTRSFVDNFSFNKKNPPNAAFIGTSKDGKTSTVIVELTKPIYAKSGRTLSYEARVLDDAEVNGRFKSLVDHNDIGLPTNFRDVSLFIDDCDDATVNCTGTYDYRGATQTATWQADCGTCYDYHWGSACWNCNVDNCDNVSTNSSCYEHLPTPFPSNTVVTSAPNPGDTEGDC